MTPSEHARRPAQPLSLGKARFEAFSDGVFAIAITLLILEVHLPSSVSASSSGLQQTHALLVIWPQYLVYVASFATIGIMWLNHHALFHNARRISLGTLSANLFLLLLLLISFLPFPTAVLGQFGLTPPAVVYYGTTVSLIAGAFTLVYLAVLRAHPGSGRPFTAWNGVGLLLYPAATVAGAFAPVLGLAPFIALAGFYFMPANVRRAVIRPPEAEPQV
jgi:uncharacterized membrane protein